MHFVGIVASHRANSHSRQFCEWVLKGAAEVDSELSSEIIELCSTSVDPCLSCGHCGRVSGVCAVESDSFARVRDRLSQADVIVIVSPHYAPVPARLCALLERLESTHFFGHFYREDFYGPLHGKPYGMVAHGAGPWAQSYKAMVLDTIENACDTIGLKLIRRESFPENGFFIPAENEQNRQVFPPAQVYPGDTEDMLKEYGALLVRQVLSAGQRVQDVRRGAD